jgi:hypothetical protein
MGHAPLPSDMLRVQSAAHSRSRSSAVASGQQAPHTPNAIVFFYDRQLSPRAARELQLRRDELDAFPATNYSTVLCTLNNSHIEGSPFPVVRVSPLVSGHELPQAYRDALDKEVPCCGWQTLNALSVFRLTQYERVLLLDTDVVILKDPAPLFRMSEPLVFTRGPWSPLNRGVFLFDPHVLRAATVRHELLHMHHLERHYRRCDPTSGGYHNATQEPAFDSGTQMLLAHLVDLARERGLGARELNACVWNHQFDFQCRPHWRMHDVALLHKPELTMSEIRAMMLTGRAGSGYPGRFASKPTYAGWHCH